MYLTQLTLNNFIDHIIRIGEGYVSNKDGPLKKFSNDYVMHMPAEKLEIMANEDESTMNDRKYVNQMIVKLEKAREIVAAVLQKSPMASY
jgi:hypothetical protein